MLSLPEWIQVLLGNPAIVRKVTKLPLITIGGDVEEAQVDEEGQVEETLCDDRGPVPDPTTPLSIEEQSRQVRLVHKLVHTLLSISFHWIPVQNVMKEIVYWLASSNPSQCTSRASFFVEDVWLTS